MTTQTQWTRDEMSGNDMFGHQVRWALEAGVITEADIPTGDGRRQLDFIGDVVEPAWLADQRARATALDCPSWCTARHTGGPTPAIPAVHEGRVAGSEGDPLTVDLVLDQLHPEDEPKTHTVTAPAAMLWGGGDFTGTRFDDPSSLRAAAQVLLTAADRLEAALAE